MTEGQGNGGSMWRFLSRIEKDIERLTNKTDRLAEEVRAAIADKADKSSVREIYRRLDELSGKPKNLQQLSAGNTRVLGGIVVVVWLLLYFKGPIFRALGLDG